MGLVSVYVLAGVFSVSAWAQPATVKMIQLVRPPEAAWQEEVVGRFHASQSEIRVELVSTAGSDLVTKMLSMLAAGTPLDIGYHDPPLVVNWAKRGIVKDITPYLERDGEAFESFYPVLLDLASIQGRRYGVPMDFQVTGLHYSVEKFAEAGVAEPSDTTSWDDIVSFGHKFVKDLNNDGVPDRWAVQFPRWTNWWWVLWAFGADFFDDPNMPTRFTGDSPQMRDGLSFFYSAIHEAGIMAPRTVVASSPPVALLADQSVAMAMGTSLNIQDLRTLRPDGGWNAARLPHGPAGNPAEVHGLTWFIFEDSQQPDAAWEVIKFFSSDGVFAVVDGTESVTQVIENWKTALNAWIQQDRQQGSSPAR